MGEPMDTGDLEWGDAPARGVVGEYPWVEIGQRLAQRPGEWARMAVFDSARAASALVRHVKRGGTALDADGHEVKSRRLSDESWGVWIRCVTNDAEGEEG